MSRFQVGDTVRCVEVTVNMDPGETDTVAKVNSSDNLIFLKDRGYWGCGNCFELIPAESPDDWVEITDPDHIPRVGIDWFEGCDGWEVQQECHTKWTVGHFAEYTDGKHRCRRKDLPVKPVAVCSGGPYVARSEYERVCAELKRISADRINHIAEAANATKQRDDALALASEIRNSSMAGLSLCSDEIKDLRQEVVDLRKQLDDSQRNVEILRKINNELKEHGTSETELRRSTQNLSARCSDLESTCDRLQRELNNEKVSSGQVIQGLRDSLKEAHLETKQRTEERDNAEAEAVRIRDEAVKLGQERDNLKRQLFHADQCREETFQRWTACKEALKLAEIAKRAVTMERDVAESRLELEAVNNPNGWPLVPVDPSCIPTGHRAVEVAAEVIGKCIVSLTGKPHVASSRSRFPRLVVEPIPAEQPSPDPLPIPEPPAWLRQGWWYWCGSDGYWCIGENQPVWDGTRWSPKGGHTGIHTSDMCHPIDKSRASEACWQVK